MRDYAELINQFRECWSRRNCLDCPYDSEETYCIELRFKDAADAIEELVAERDKALNRLCEFCGICSEQSRNPFECEVAGFIPAPLPKGVE